MKLSFRVGSLPLPALAIFGLCVSALAQQKPPAVDLAALDIEALLNMEVTTASRFAQKLSDAPGIVSVISSDQLRRFGGMTLGEVLQRVPGLTASTQFVVDRTMVAARGDQIKSSGGHILFLINGRPTREVLEGGVISDLLESFPVEALEQIEVIKGPGSVLYGSNAFSAVINLITRKAEGTEATLRVQRGPSDAQSSSLSATFQHGNLSGTAAGQTHGFPDWPLVSIIPPAQRPRFPDVPIVRNVLSVKRGSGGYLGLNYGGFSFMSAFTEAQSNSFGTGDFAATRLTRAFGNLGYHRSVSPKWEMDFNATFTRTTFDGAGLLVLARDSREFLAEWTNFVKLSAKDRLTAGFVSSKIGGLETANIIGNRFPDVQGSRLAQSIYAQIEHQVQRDLKLVAGFQTNKIGGHEIDTVPRAGILWSPAPWASVKVLYGRAFRAPSLDENLLSSPVLQGNPDLHPEKVGTLDFGVGFQGKHFQAGVNYFHSKQTDGINFKSIPGGPLGQVNSGEVIFQGFEAEGKYYIKKSLFAQGSILYQTNHDEFGNVNLSPVPNIGFKTGLSYSAQRGIAISLFDVFDGAVNGISYRDNVNPFPGRHHILNGDVRYDLAKYLPAGAIFGAALVIHVNNLTNHPVWLPAGYHVGDTVPAQQGRVVFAGIEFTAGRK